MNTKFVRCFQSFAVACVIVLSMLGATGVSAESSAVPEIVFADVTGKAGEEVTVPVSIKNNTGIATFRFRVTYDTDALELVSIKAGSLLTTGSFSSTTDVQESHLTMLWYSVTNVTGDGELAYLTFRIADEAKGSYPLTVTYLPEDLLSENSQTIPHTLTEGKVIVQPSFLLGDVDVDGDVDTLDALSLFEHVNGQTELSSEALAVADVTGDGVIGLADAVRVFYIAAGLI